MSSPSGFGTDVVYRVGQGFGADLDFLASRPASCRCLRSRLL